MVLEFLMIESPKRFPDGRQCFRRLSCQVANQPIHNRLLRVIRVSTDAIPEAVVRVQIREDGTNRIVIPSVVAQGWTGSLPGSIHPRGFDIVRIADPEDPTRTAAATVRVAPADDETTLARGAYVAQVIVTDGLTDFITGEAKFMVGEKLEACYWL